VLCSQDSLSEHGELLRNDVFSVSESKKDHRSLLDLRLKSHTRHIFLYEQLVVFCKKKDDSVSKPDKPATYTLKNSLAVSSLFYYLR